MIIPRTASRPRSFLSAVAATAIGFGVLGAVPPAAAETDEPVEQQTVELAVDIGDHGAISHDSPVSGTATVQNVPDAELSAGQLSVEIDRTALADMSAVESWLDLDSAPGAFDTVFSAPTEVIAPDAEDEVPFFVPAAAVTDLAPGVYPVRVTLNGARLDDEDEAETLTARTVLTVRDGSTPAIGILVPITATPASGDLLSAAELEGLTGEDGALTAQLDAVVGTAATLAVDPAIAAAIRVLGSAAPESAVEWLSRLETLPNDVFTLRFGDADAAVQAQAGLEKLLGPTTLDVFKDVENAPPTPSPSPSPTPSTAGLDPEPASDVEELTAIDGAIDDVLWPRPDVTAADLAAFDDYLGSATTILSSSAIDGPDGAHLRVGDADVLVTDEEASALLSEAAAQPDEGERDATLAEATAALHFAGAPASGLLIGLDRDETRTRDALRDAISATSAVGMQSIRDLPTSSAGLLTPPESTRAADLKMLLADEERLGAFASILEDDQLLLAPERIRILRLLAVDHDDEEFGEAYREHRADTADTLDSVAIQEYSGPIQLFSANVDLPVWIRNDLPWPVTLTLEVRPSDPRIDVEPYTEVEALATSNTKVQIPVAARIASGELRVGFSLSSPNGVAIGQSQTADVNVRAEWEGIGLAILGGVIVLLLGFGVIRTVRRRRREAGESGARAEPVEPAEPAEAPEPVEAPSPEASEKEES